MKKPYQKTIIKKEQRVRKQRFPYETSERKEDRKKKIFQFRKLKKKKKARFHVRKCLLLKKLAACNCFQEVIYLLRKVSGLHSATRMSWNLRSSRLSLFEPEILHLLRKANNASRTSLVHA